MGLPGSVLPDKDIDTGGKLYFKVFKIGKIFKPDVFEHKNSYPIIIDRFSGPSPTVSCSRGPTPQNVP
jgi:hypothetical protein